MQTSRVAGSWLASASRNARRFVLAAISGLGICLATGVAANAQTDYPGGRWAPGPAKYDAEIVGAQLVMRDGVLLDGQIAFPVDRATGKRAAGPFPVVVEHTPYVRIGETLRYFAEYGYISVVLNSRGTGKSGGELTFFSALDGEDGKEIIDWAAHKLAGADGRVALIGCSFPASLALTDAAHVGPKSPLKAVIAACIGLTGPHRLSWMLGGLPTPLAYSGFTDRPPAAMGNTASARSFVRTLAEDLIAGKDPAYEGEFWGQRLSLDLAPKIVENDIPVLLWTGWRDTLYGGAFRTYTAFQNAYHKRAPFGPILAGQKTTPRYQIIVGDWEHGQNLDRGIYLQWLDTWVKGADTGIQNTTTPMHLRDPGSKRWVNAAHYPIASRYTTWYANDAGALALKRPGKSTKQTLKWGEPEQAETKLAFTTEPLTSGATLGGPISATVYASSSNTNLEVIANLYDVAPDGKARHMTIGAVLGSLRELDAEKSWTDRAGKPTWPWVRMDADSYLVPGKVYRFDIWITPVQWSLAPGHRLRVELTTQTPKAVCEAAYRGPTPCGLTKTQEATVPGGVYTIHYGARWPTSINLPQLPLDALPAVREGLPPTPSSASANLPEDRTIPLDWGN